MNAAALGTEDGLKLCLQGWVQLLQRCRKGRAVRLYARLHGTQDVLNVSTVRLTCTAGHTCLVTNAKQKAPDSPEADCGNTPTSAAY